MTLAKDKPGSRLKGHQGQDANWKGELKVTVKQCKVNKRNKHPDLHADICICMSLLGYEMPSHFYDSLVVEEGLDEAGVLQGDQQE